MKSRGHEVCEVLVDLEPVQKTWAWERGLEIEDRDWMSQVLLQQMLEFKPEVLFLQGFHALPVPLRLTIKKRVPSLELVVIQQGPCQANSTVLRELSRADVLFVSSAVLERVCLEAGLEPHRVYEAFDPSVLCELPAPSKLDEASKLDASFLGTTGERADHARREHYLSGLIRDGGVEVYARQLTAAGRVRRRASALGTTGGERLHPALYGLDYFEVMQRSRVSLNIHCDSAGDHVGNRRMFEATGVGSCLLTDRGENLDEIFEDGREVVTYSDLDDAREKLRYLLDHESERRAIAEAGRARTLSEHTVAKRVAAIDEEIQQALTRHRKATRTRWRGLAGSLST